MAKKKGNNEGTITKLPSGSYRAQVTLDGQRLSFTSKTRSECQAWVRKTLDHIDEGLTYEGSQTTLDEYLKNWLVTAKTALRPKTGHQYQQLVEYHIIPVLGKWKLKELRPDTIDRFYQNRIQAGVGNRTVRYLHSVLHKALEKAVKLGLLTRNPADGATPPRLDQGEMLVMNESQVTQFLIAAQGNRYEVMFHVAVKTGMRQAELLGLKWNDLDWTTGLLQVKRQVQRVDGKGYVFVEPKTKTGRRTIQLGEASLQALRQQMERQNFEKDFAGGRSAHTHFIERFAGGESRHSFGHSHIDPGGKLRHTQILRDRGGLLADGLKDCGNHRFQRQNHHRDAFG